MFVLHIKKRGASLSLVPLRKAFALPELSKRATKKPHVMQVYKYPQLDKNKVYALLRNVYNTPIGRSRCFVFDNSLEFAKFYGVKTKAYSYAFYMYNVHTTKLECGTLQI